MEVADGVAYGWIIAVDGNRVNPLGTTLSHPTSSMLPMIAFVIVVAQSCGTTSIIVTWVGLLTHVHQRKLYFAPSGGYGGRQAPEKERKE